MFGPAGPEKYMGVLNALVLSRLQISEHKTTFWVVHTKGEDATSRLIQELKKKMKSEQVFDLVRAVDFKETMEPTSPKLEAVKLIKFENGKTLEDALKACTGPGLIGMTKEHS